MTHFRLLYSGKAKRHTTKTQYTTTYDGLIVHKSIDLDPIF